MAVTTSNVLAGPGTLYAGKFGIAEPAKVTEAPGTGWRDVGGTSEGVTIAVSTEFTELTVDQVIDMIDRRPTSRDLTVATNLAEATLENFALVTNELSSIDESVTGQRSLSPTTGVDAFEPDSIALLFDGRAPGVRRRRRLAVRKSRSIEGTETAYTKDGMTVLSCTFGAHFVSDAIKPYSIIDQNTATP